MMRWNSPTALDDPDDFDADDALPREDPPSPCGDELQARQAANEQHAARCTEALWNARAAMKAGDEEGNETAWLPNADCPQLKDPLPLSMLTPGVHGLRPLPAPLTPEAPSQRLNRRRLDEDFEEEALAAGLAAPESPATGSLRHSARCAEALSNARVALQVVTEDEGGDEAWPPEVDCARLKDPLPLSLLTPGEHAPRAPPLAPDALPLPPQPRLPAPPCRPVSAGGRRPLPLQPLRVPAVPAPPGGVVAWSQPCQSWLPPAPVLPQAPL